MNIIRSGIDVTRDAAVALCQIGNNRRIAVGQFFQALNNTTASGLLPLDQLIGIGKRTGLDVTAYKLNCAELINFCSELPILLVAADGSPIILHDVSVLENGSQAEQFEFSVSLRNLQAENNGSFVNTVFDAPELEKIWSGVILKIAAIENETSNVKKPKFGLNWFFSLLTARRDLLAIIVAMIAAVHIVGLAIPLFFQAVVDKVLVNETVGTLQVLTIGVVVAVLFDSFFKFCRDYMIGHLAAKMDIQAADTTFRHMLSLPLTFFGRNTAGVISNNMQQVEEVRNFITGRFLFSAIEATAFVIFVPILFFYSSQLAWIVIAAGVSMAIVVGVLIRPFMRILKRIYAAEGQLKTLLVETTHGIQTVKSLSLEESRLSIWRKENVRRVEDNFKLRKLSAFGAAVINGIEQISGVAVMYFGVLAVLNGSLTLGSLIAFRMLSEQVTEPLKNFAEAFHEWQQTSLSARMIGTIMDEPSERMTAAAAAPSQLNGSVTFEDVSFAFHGASGPVLSNVTFEIESGEVIGVVGRSGSGKSTIAKLLQGLYVPDKGQIRVGGINIQTLDKTFLRRSVSVVLQDSFLFLGSIADNIGMAGTAVTTDEIITAASMTGASEFIEKLPSGYETLIEEGGTNFSGGQRQKIAIARSLIGSPAVLIFDEATSALDAESETVIQNTLEQISQQGRTIVLIAHRLATLVFTTRIMVFDDGHLIDFRSLDELLDVETGCNLFRNLWQTQMRQNV